MKKDQPTSEAGASARLDADHFAASKLKPEGAAARADGVVSPLSLTAPAPLPAEASVIEVGVGVRVEEERVVAPEPPEPHEQEERSHLEITAPQPAAAAVALLGQPPPPPPMPSPSDKESAAVKLRYLLFAVLATLLVVGATAFGTAYFLRYTMQLEGRSAELKSPSRERDTAAADRRSHAKERSRAAQPDDEEESEESDTPEPAPANKPAAPADHAVPAAMVAIPGGTYRMGSRDGARDERPEHTEVVHQFFIDQLEVSVAEYDKCVAAGECRKQRTTHQPEGDHKFDRFCNYGRKNRDQHPMNCIDWYQARAFCRWAGKRLPTETEWEYAARGTDGLTYPWGNEGPSERQLNACGHECSILGEQIGKDWNTMYPADDGWDATAPVGHFPRDRSPFSVLDMGGNVSEWTDTLYARCYREDCEASGKERVIRGGSWSDDDPRDVRGAYRNRDLPLMRASFVGFRCAKNNPGPAASRP